MRQDIEDAVNRYYKEYTDLFNLNGAAEAHLRQWCCLNYYHNPFKATSNANLYKSWISLKNDASDYDDNLQSGRLNIIMNPEGCVLARKNLKHVRYEMWRRGIVDGVYDRWHENEDEILKRIETMPEINSPDFKYIDGRDRDGKRIKS